MHEDVQKYFDHRDARERANNKAEEDYYDACRKARAALAETKSKIENEDGWEALKKSSDPMVKWIAENCEEYRDQAEEILKALPAPLETLQEIAERNDWCREWDRFVLKARRAGVITDDRTPELQALDEWFRDYYGRNETFQRHLKLALAAEREAGRAEARAAKS